MRGAGRSLVFCLLATACHHARTEPPTLSVPRATGTITLDGRLDEPDWARAARTGPLVDTMTGEGPGARNARGEVRVLWDARSLYVAFEVEDHDLVDVGEGTDPHLWEHDAAEVMIDPDGDWKNYFEMQASPGAHVFDTRYDLPRIPRPFGDLSWSSGMVLGVDARGTVNQPDDDDRGYTVEMALPWTSFQVPGPPHPGETWSVDFYLMDEGKNGRQTFAGWSPPLRGDFHTPSRFGRLTFE